MKLKSLIKIVFIFAAFFIIYNKIDFNQLKNITIENYYFIFLAFLFFNLSQIFSAIRLKNYLENIGISTSKKFQIALYYIGMLYNNILPGGIGGDGYKIYLFEKKFKKGYKKIFQAMLIDRIAGAFAILTLIGFFSNFIFLIFAPIFLFLLQDYFFKEFSKINFLYSIIIQLLQGISFVFILFALGESKNLLNYLTIFYISSLVSVIPISVGGVGLRELSFLYLANFFNINSTFGIVASFLFFIISLLSSLIGIIFLKRIKDV